jgi:uncharacterized protein with FMN-binding domain
MRRAPLVIGSTALGLGGVLGFHTQKPATAHAVARAAPGAPASTTPAISTQTAGKKTTPAKSTAWSTRTAVGEDVPNQYGDVQVRVTVKGKKVTRVTAVALPQSDPKSQEISSFAAPQLAQEAVAAQSGQIDGVSGASYTSESYKTSLQSALDKLGVRA